MAYGTDYKTGLRLHVSVSVYPSVHKMELSENKKDDFSWFTVLTVNFRMIIQLLT